jgi:DNA-binding NarL/FixJ family response regulator
MIRVIVVDDHPVVRHGLVSMLHWEKDIEIVGEAADGPEALRLILERRPDVVLLDLRLPGMSGVDVMRQAHGQAPEVRFLVLTTYYTDEYIGPALAAGAHGYLLKDVTPDELAQAVRLLMHGGAPLEPRVAARMLELASDEHRDDELSPRELEVLQLLSQGASNKAIAGQLALTENTVKSHISRIFDKLGVQNRAEAVTTAIKRGLLTIGEN